MTYRAELSGRALKQVNGLPGPAFDSLIEAMADVADYHDDRSGPSRPVTLTSGGQNSARRAWSPI